MLQKIMLEVEASKPLNSYGEGHVIVYNAQRNNYYVTTRENFLSPQNAKIATLEKTIVEAENKIRKTQEELNKTVTNLLQAFTDYQIKTKEEQARFYETYKETNAKMLDLVKKSCVAGE